MYHAPLKDLLFVLHRQLRVQRMRIRIGNPDQVAVEVVNTLFGGRYTSLLNTALRVDSGLTYGARSAFDQRRLAGPFTISSYTRNATTEKAIDMALDVLRNFHDTGVTEADLQLASKIFQAVGMGSSL